MFRKRKNIVLWLLCVTSLHYGQCCGPAEIGKAYTIVSKYSVPSNAEVQWLQNGNSVYNTSLSVPNIYPEEYGGTRSQLKILNVTKNDGTGAFKHFVNGSPVYECLLRVYKRASIPTCESVTLTGNHIRTNCTTAEVFPQAKCQFTLQNDGTDKRDLSDGNITYSHSNLPGQEYDSTSCALQYPVNGLKPGALTVKVNMYPDLTDVSLAQGTTGQAPNTLQLSIPTVNIGSTNCPKGLGGEGNTNVRNGYIRQGKRASCMCSRAHAGNPPGTIGWSSTQEGNFVNLSQSENSATIQINSPDNFTCQSKSVLDGTPHSMTYTPKYAYGPSSASLTIQPTGPIYLCPNRQSNIDITCQVPVNSFNPSALFTIRDRPGNSLVTNVAGDNAWSKSVNYNFTRSGAHTFICQVENKVFSDIFSEAPSRAVQVYVPPSKAPVLSARSSKNGTDLVEGDDVTVTCVVSGGYPSVQSVTLTCERGDTVKKSGTTARIKLDKIGLSQNDTHCTCQATHVTGCYDLKGSLFLTVLAVQPETIFTAGDLAGAVIGVFIGTLVLVAVIALIVFFVRKRNNAEETRQHYENWNPRDKDLVLVQVPGQSSDNNAPPSLQSTEESPPVPTKSNSLNQPSGSSNDYDVPRSALMKTISTPIKQVPTVPVQTPGEDSDFPKGDFGNEASGDYVNLTVHNLNGSKSVSPTKKINAGNYVNVNPNVSRKPIPPTPPKKDQKIKGLNNARSQ